MKKKFLYFGFVLVLLSSCTHVQEKSTTLIDSDVEKKISELISKMTLREKIGQMFQLNYWGDTISADYINLIKNSEIGSFLNVKDAATVNELQRIAVEESRLGIPLIIGFDVIHGYRTIFPIPVGQSCSWNTELITEASRISAKEATVDGIRWTFAPMIDITRNPKWGRIAETCGEDPYLTSVLGVAMIKGFQGNDLKNPERVAACAKHYVGYGATEDGRDYNSTWIPETELRNVYLPSFRAAVDSGVATVMSAFNDLNGIPTSGNKHTIREILLNEYQFNGFVVSDWASITEMIKHGYCADEKEAAEKAANAGVHMEMKSKSYLDNLETLVAEKKVSIKDIDDAVRRILRIKFQLGLFENPYTDTTRSKEILCDEHKQVAQEIAEESAVLLKNENSVLPLSKDIKTLAVIGPLANSGKDQLGTWAGRGKGEESVTPLMALKQLLGDDKVLYTAGLETSRTTDKADFQNAINVSKKADAVVVFVGEESILSGEAHSRAFINLPGAQEELIAAVAKTGKPVVVVIMAGRPLTFNNIDTLADGIVFMFHPGTMGGPAISNILFGNKIPSGKLTFSFPRTVGQVPIYYSKRNTGRPPTDKNFGIPTGTTLNPIGYSSSFLDVSVLPQYPFGYGLSYSTFEYSNLTIVDTIISASDSLTVVCTVKNTGKYDADEIVQFYIHDLFGSLTRPIKELKAFQKIFIKSGESKEVKFTIPASRFGFYDINSQFIIEKGAFDCWVAPNSDEGVKGKFHIE